jgi:NitT/TauT family transport system ATP-binding protein
MTALSPSITTPEPAIALRGVGRAFAGYVAVENITLDIVPGRFVAVVGPSGCGKSTVLNIIAGLTPPTAGVVKIFGRQLTGINRRACYMFQDDALLPWKTVIENIQLGLTFRGRKGHAPLEEANRWLARVGLRGFGDHYPAQLSGGMRKRVAIAQTWIVQPDVVLMDEPFAALDVHTRLRIESEILELWADSQPTVVFVTHDLEEAILLADEVFLLSAGPRSRVLGRYAIDMPRPRNLIDIKMEPRFHELFRAIWTDLRQEVLQSFERNA